MCSKGNETFLSNISGYCRGWKCPQTPSPSSVILVTSEMVNWEMISEFALPYHGCAAAAANSSVEQMLSQQLAVSQIHMFLSV